MLLDIVILPPKEIRSRIGLQMKKEVGNSLNYFVVDNKKLIPHLSLWHLRTSEKRLPKIIGGLKQVVKNQKPIKISSSGFRDLGKFKGCVTFRVKNNKSMEVLQDKVFKNIYHHKTGMMPSFALFLRLQSTKKKLKEVKKYGRELGFHPHFTMGWLKNKKDVLKIVKNMQKVKFNFLAKEIYICEIDKWWQVKRIIKKVSFPLK